MPSNAACKELDNKSPKEPPNVQYVISQATKDDSVHSRRKSPMAKIKEISSDGVPNDFQHSTAQNKSDNSECWTEMSRLGVKKYNFELSTHTSIEENAKVISSDDVQRKSQNVSQRETLENSKSSAETTRPAVQTDHLAVSTDVTSKCKSEEKSDNLKTLQDKMPEKTDIYSDQKSGLTRDYSATYLTHEGQSEDELDNLNNMQDKMPEEADTYSVSISGTERDDSVAYSTHEEKSEEELDNLNNMQDKTPKETNTYPDPKSGSTKDDSVSYSTRKGKSEEKILDKLNNMQFTTPEEADTYSVSKSGTTRDDSAAYSTHEEKSTKKEFDNFNNMQNEMPEETDTDPDKKSGTTMDDSAAYSTQGGKSKKDIDIFNNIQDKMPMETNTYLDTTYLDPKSGSTRDDPVAYSTHEGQSEQKLDNLNNMQHKMPEEADTYSVSKSGTTRDDSAAYSTHGGKSKEELDILNYMQNEMQEETDTGPDQKSGTTRDDSVAYSTHKEQSEEDLDRSTMDDSATYLTRKISMAKIKEISSDGDQSDFQHPTAQNESDNSKSWTETSHLEKKKCNSALSTHTLLEENAKVILPVDGQRKVLKSSTSQENSKSSAKLTRPEVQSDHLVVSTDETFEDKSEEKIANLKTLRDKMPEETDTDLDQKSGLTRDNSVAYLTHEGKSKEELDNLNNKHEKMQEDTVTFSYSKSGTTWDDSATYLTREGKSVEELDDLNNLQNKIPKEINTDSDPKSGSTMDDNIVDHGKFKSTGSTGNTSIKNHTQKTVHTTKKVLSNGFLILSTILILVQLLTAVFVYTILGNNIKEQIDELKRTELNRLAEAHNKMMTENLFHKDNNYVIELSDENWKRITKMITEESEESRTFTENILDTRLKQEHKKIILIKGWLNKLEYQMNTLKNNYRALKRNYLKLQNRIIRNEKFFSGEIYDICFYIVVLLFAVGITVVLVAYGNRTLGGTVPKKVPNVQTLKSGFGTDDQLSSALVEKLSRKNIEMGVGIISFNSSTQENHQRSFQAIDIPLSLPVKAYVVLKLDDLMLVEPYTQMILFVDSNERNIILENSKTEIGDIRRRTTEFLLGAGCDVFVVYYRDKNSKSLPKENIYNISLYSIDNHTVLSSLRSRDRVFSVYDTFHPQQVQMLKNCFK